MMTIVQQMNGWNAYIIHTVDKWYDVAFKLLGVYDKAADKYLLREKKVKTLAAVIAAVLMGVSALQLNQDALGYRIALTVLTIIELIINGYHAINNPDLATYLRYTEKLRHFTGNIASQLTIPLETRDDGMIFVDKHKNIYLDLLINRPNIIGEDDLIHFKFFDNELFQILKPHNVNVSEDVCKEPSTHIKVDISPNTEIYQSIENGSIGSAGFNASVSS
jgi:hypothetical protein